MTDPLDEFLDGKPSALPADALDSFLDGSPSNPLDSFLDSSPGALEQARQLAISKGRKRIQKLQAGENVGISDVEALARGVFSGVTAGATEGALALAGAGGDRERIERVWPKEKWLTPREIIQGLRPSGNVPIEGSVPYFVGQNILAPLVPVGEVATAVGKAKTGMEVLKRAATTGGRMGAVFGAGGGVSEAAMQEKPTVTEALKSGVKGLAIGGGIGLGLGLLGGGLAAREFNRAQAIQQAEEEAFRLLAAQAKEPVPPSVAELKKAGAFETYLGGAQDVVPGWLERLPAPPAGKEQLRAGMLEGNLGGATGVVPAVPEPARPGDFNFSEPIRPQVVPIVPEQAGPGDFNFNQPLRPGVVPIVPDQARPGDFNFTEPIRPSVVPAIPEQARPGDFNFSEPLRPEAVPTIPEQAAPGQKLQQEPLRPSVVPVVPKGAEGYPSGVQAKAPVAEKPTPQDLARAAIEEEAMGGRPAAPKPPAIAPERAVEAPAPKPPVETPPKPEAPTKPSKPLTVEERTAANDKAISDNLKRKSGMGVVDPNTELAELLAKKAALSLEKQAKKGTLAKALGEGVRSIIGERRPGREQTIVEKLMPIQDLRDDVLTQKMRSLGELEFRSSQMGGLLNEVASKAKEEHLPIIEAYWKGDLSAGEKLPTPVRVAAENFRMALDEASAAFAGRDKALSEQMRQTIIDNQGKYLNRSFAIHNERSWLANMRKAAEGDKEAGVRWAKAYRDAVEEVRDKSSTPMTEGQAQNVVDDWLDWHAKQAVSKDLAAMSDKPRIPQNPLHRRKDLSDAMLVLLGEERDPIVSAGRSAALLSEMNSKALLSESLAQMTFDGVPAAFDVNPGIKGYRLLEGPAYGSLDGKWVHPEIKGIMDETALIHDQMRSVILDFIVRFAEGWRRSSGVHQFNAFFKMAKTVFSPLTHVTNFVGNTGFSALRGNAITNPANWPHYYDAIRIMAKYSPGAKASAVRRLAALESKKSPSKADAAEILKLRDDIADYTFREELVKNHIIGSNYAKAELLQLQTMIRDGMPLLKAMFRYVQRGMKTAQGLYGAGDDVFKAAAVIKDMKSGKAKSWEQAQVDTYRSFPMYTMAGPMLKLAREIPAFNLFISFPAESARVLTRSLVEAAAKGTASERIRGVAKVAAIAGSFAAMEKGIAALMQSRKEKDQFDANRQLLQDYQKFSNVIPVGKDKDGKWMLLDLGQVNPWGAWEKTFRAAAAGDVNAVVASNPIVNMYNQPIIQVGLASADWYKGRDIKDHGTNKLIAARSEPPAVKAQKMALWTAGMLGSPIQPGGREYERIKNVNKPDIWGRVVTGTDLAIMYLTGIRPSRWSPETEAKKRLAELDRQVVDSKSQMKREVMAAQDDKSKEDVAIADHIRRLNGINAAKKRVAEALRAD